MSDKVRIGGLWLNQTKDGRSYMAGNFGQGRILVYKNDYKRGENDPDYVMYIAARQQQSEPEAEETDEPEQIPF